MSYTPKHREAFCLMNYSDKENTTLEMLWNTRDGVTPFRFLSRDKSVEIFHNAWDQDIPNPYFIPPVGMRVFVDGRGDKPAVKAVTQQAHDAVFLALTLHVRLYKGYDTISIWENKLKAIFKNA